jgi:hypothetical protein
MIHWLFRENPIHQQLQSEEQRFQQFYRKYINGASLTSLAFRFVLLGKPQNGRYDAAINTLRA